MLFFWRSDRSLVPLLLTAETTPWGCFPCSCRASSSVKNLFDAARNTCWPSFCAHALLPPPPHEKKNIVGGWRQSTQSVCQSARGGDQSTQSLSPTMFEVVTGEFRWHLRSKRRGPRGQSGHTWLNIFCGDWKREARQDVGVRVCVLRLDASA